MGLLGRAIGGMRRAAAPESLRGAFLPDMAAGGLMGGAAGAAMNPDDPMGGALAGAGIGAGGFGAVRAARLAPGMMQGLRAQTQAQSPRVVEWYREALKQQYPNMAAQVDTMPAADVIEAAQRIGITLE